MTTPCAPSTARAYSPTTLTAVGGPPPLNQPLWTDDEHNNFLAGLKEFGRSWESISLHLVPTRTTEQVKNYAAVYFYNEGKNATSAAAKPAPARKAPPARSEKKDNGHWTDGEHEFFLECWAKYGKSWKKISEVMKTRTNEQIRTHAQKYFAKLDQLRSCGYEGDYAMDGTRHLTKTFLKKAEEKGVSPGKVKISFKMSSPRGVVKRRANRQGKAVARLRGGSAAPRRGKPQGGGGGRKKEEEVEEAGAGKEEEGAGNKEDGKEGEGAEGLLQLAVTSYTTRSRRVATSAQPLQQAQAQAEAAMAMEVDEGEGGAAHQEEDDRKQEAAPTTAAVVMTIETGAGEEGEGEEGLNDFHDDQGHADDHHDAKQEEHGKVERAGMEIDPTAELVAVAPTVPTPRTVGDILTSFTMDPNGFLHWGQADRGSGAAAAAAAAAAATVPEGWMVLPEVPGQRNNTGSLSIATTAMHVSVEMTSSTSSSSASTASSSASTASSSASTSEGATQRDSMMLMMSSGDGTLLWESDGYNADEDENNSLTRPPTSPAAAADLVHWATDEEGLWAGEEGGKGEDEATAKMEGAAVFEI